MRWRAKPFTVLSRRSGMARFSKIIGGQGSSAKDGPGRTRPHPELSVVSLARDIEADGLTFPAGARGTVVAAYADGKGYEVELFDPVHAVVTVETRGMAD